MLDLFAVILGGATALLPIFAKDVFDAGPLGPRACCALRPPSARCWSSVALTRWSFTRSVGRIEFMAVAVFGVATIVFGLSGWFWLSWAALAIMGAADSVSVVIRMTLLQLETPDDMRGRVNAVNSLFSRHVQPARRLPRRRCRRIDRRGARGAVRRRRHAAGRARLHAGVPGTLPGRGLPRLAPDVVFSPPRERAAFGEHGMTTRELNDFLTLTGPGTPMGTLFRRYWMPALLSAELPEPDCPPVRVKLLANG